MYPYHRKFWFCSVAAAIACLVSAGPASAQPRDEKTIVIEGSAAGTNANAMEQAKQDALRKAVEQACGTFISAQTKTKDYAAVRDKIMSLATRPTGWATCCRCCVPAACR